jgi:carbon monoxide dehydrogenase subunit G
MVKFRTTTVEVKRPSTEVFAYLSDVSRQSEWSSAVESCRVEGFGSTGRGTRYIQTIKLLGRRIESICEVSDHQPDRRIEFAAVSGPMPHKWDVELEAVDGSTRITMHGEAEPGGLFRLAGPILRRAMRRQAQSDLGNLRDILEAR